MWTLILKKLTGLDVMAVVRMLGVPVLIFLLLLVKGWYADSKALDALKPQYQKLQQDHAALTDEKAFLANRLANADAALNEVISKSQQQELALAHAKSDIVKLQHESVKVVEKIRTVHVPGKCDDAVDWAIKYGETRKGGK